MQQKNNNRLRQIAAIAAAIIALFVSASCTPSKRPADPAVGTVYILNTLTVPERKAHRIIVNGESIGELNSRQYTRFSITPGVHEITITGTPLFDNRLSARQLTLRSGQTRYLVYDQENRAPYLLEYDAGHAETWLNKARFVSNRLLRRN